MADMILIDIEVYNFTEGNFLLWQGLVNTGASLCTIARHNAEALGLSLNDKQRHFWQVRDPLVMEETTLRLRYNGKTYDVVVGVLEIPKAFRRWIHKGEECSRPKKPNPLSNIIVIGENFLQLLSENERKQIGSLLLR